MNIRALTWRFARHVTAALCVACTSAHAYPGAALNLPTLVDESVRSTSPDGKPKSISGTNAITRSDGTTFVIWTRSIDDPSSQFNGTKYIVGKRFASDGSSMGDDQLLFDPIPGQFEFPEISTAINRNDVFVVGYSAKGEYFVRLFSRDGAPLTPVIQVGTSPDWRFDTSRPAVAITDDGRFAIAWLTVKERFVGNAAAFATKTLSVQRFTNRGVADGRAITVSQERWNSLQKEPYTRINRLELAYDRQNLLSVNWFKGNGSRGDVYLSTYDDRGRRVGPLLPLSYPPVLKDVTELGFYIDALNQRHVAYQTATGAYAKQTFDATGAVTGLALPITGILAGHDLKSVTGLSDGSFLLYTTVYGPFTQGDPPNTVSGYESRPYTQWRDSNGFTMRDPTEFGVSDLLHPFAYCASSAGNANIYAVVCEMTGALAPFQPYHRLYVEMHSLN